MINLISRKIRRVCRNMRHTVSSICSHPQTNGQNHLLGKLKDSDLIHIFEDETKLKIPSEITLPLSETFLPPKVFLSIWWISNTWLSSSWIVETWALQYLQANWFLIRCLIRCALRDFLNTNSLGGSTCPLVFVLLAAESHDLSQDEKDIVVC